MKLGRKLFIGILAIMVSVQSVANEVDELLAKMRTAYANTKSFRMTTEVSYPRAPKGAITLTGTLAFKRPNKILAKYVSLETNVEIKIVSDGKRAFLSSRSEKVQIDVAEDELPRGLPGNLEILGFWEYEKQLSTSKGHNMENSELKILRDVDWNDKKWLVLEETAHGQGVFVRYFIDPSTHFIWRTMMRDLESTEFELDSKVTSLQIDAELPDSMFQVG